MAGLCDDLPENMTDDPEVAAYRVLAELEANPPESYEQENALATRALALAKLAEVHELRALRKEIHKGRTAPRLTRKSL